MPFSSVGLGPFSIPAGAGLDVIYRYGGSLGNSITLIRDIVCNNFVLQGAVTLNTAGYRIFCNNMAMMGGALIVNEGGNATSWNSAGVGAPGKTVGLGGTGGIGGAQLVDPPREDLPAAGGDIVLCGLGGSGGSGGNAGAAGGSSTVNYTDSHLEFDTLSIGVPHQSNLVTVGALIGTPVFSEVLSNTPGSIAPIKGGAGGGGGKANTISQSHGGSGGGGGGVVFIACNGVVSMTNNSQISVNGGLGGNGLTAGGVTGGGGGGGGGGCVIISCRSLCLSDVCVIKAVGGAKGSGGGVAAQNGQAGRILIHTPNGLYDQGSAVNAATTPVFPYFVTV